jgi:hypothetical protein
LGGLTFCDFSWNRMRDRLVSFLQRTDTNSSSPIQDSKRKQYENCRLWSRCLSVAADQAARRHSFLHKKEVVAFIVEERHSFYGMEEKSMSETKTGRKGTDHTANAFPSHLSNLSHRCVVADKRPCARQKGKRKLT